MNILQFNTIDAILKLPIMEAMVSRREDGRPQFNMGNKQSAVTDDYLFHPPSTEDFWDPSKKDLLTYSSDLQDTKHMRAQSLLANLGLVDKIRLSKQYVREKSTKKKIDSSIGILENLKQKEIIKNMPLDVFKELIFKPKKKIDQYVKFNTFDILNKQRSWDNINKNLMENILSFLSGNTRRSDPSLMPTLSTRVLGEASDEDPWATTPEELKQNAAKAFNILSPLYKKAAKSGLTPMQYLGFQNAIDRLTGVLSTNDLQLLIDRKNRELPPVTTEEYIDNIISAFEMLRSTEEGKVDYVSTLYGKETVKNLNKFRLILLKRGYKGGLTPSNVYSFIKNDDSGLAENLRFVLEDLYNIDPQSLSTEKYPRLGDLVKDLYKNEGDITKRLLSISNRGANGEKPAEFGSGQVGRPGNKDNKKGALADNMKHMQAQAQSADKYLSRNSDEALQAKIEEYKELQSKFKEKGSTVTIPLQLSASVCNFIPKVRGKVKAEVGMDFGDVTFEQVGKIKKITSPKTGPEEKMKLIEYVEPKFKDKFKEIYFLPEDTSTMSPEELEKQKAIVMGNWKGLYTYLNNKASSYYGQKASELASKMSKTTGVGKIRQERIEKQTNKRSKIDTMYQDVHNVKPKPKLDFNAPLEDDDFDDSLYIQLGISNMPIAAIETTFAKLKKAYGPSGIKDIDYNIKDEDDEFATIELTILIDKDSAIDKIKKPEQVIEAIKSDIFKLLSKRFGNDIDEMEIETIAFDLTHGGGSALEDALKDHQKSGMDYRRRYESNFEEDEESIVDIVAEHIEMYL